MPGIVGIISREAPAHCEELLQQMLATMLHEPAYVCGEVSSTELGVYAGWVAHPGSFAAQQSGESPETELAVAWSGEVFDRRGKTRRLVEGYTEKGNAFFEELNGLFSGLLIDARRKEAFLVNDRYGSERLYVYEGASATYFASEAKALLRVAASTREFDPAGVAEYLALGCTTGDRTLFREIKLVPGGSLWRFDRNGGTQKTRYFLPEKWENQTELTADEFDEEFSSTLRNVLPQYLSGDQDVGISLTGGLDTRMIMACLPKSIASPVCYTFANDGRELLDVTIAAKVARVLGLPHKALRLGREFFDDYAAHLDRTVWITDGNAGAITAHEILFNRDARALAPIRVTGNFGGEVLRGVSTFKPLRLAPEILSPTSRDAVERAAEEAPNASRHPVTFSAFKEVPWNLFGTLAAARSQVTFRTPFLDNALVGAAYRAPRALRNSTLPALRLIQKNDPELARIPTDRGEIFGREGISHRLRRLYAEVTCKLDYYDAYGMPDAFCRYDAMVHGLNARVPFLGQHKLLRYRSWFRRELAPVVRRVLNDAARDALPFWNSSFIPSLASDHIGGRKNYVREINAVLTLEAVDRLLIKAARPAATGGPMHHDGPPVLVSSEVSTGMLGAD